MAKVLVTGGCGYIGSHTLVDLIENNHEPYNLDNLSNSSIEVLNGIERITQASVGHSTLDLRDLKALEQLFEEQSFDAIIHFAALKSVGESVEQPLTYYENNLLGIINLLKCQVKYKVCHFIFSSSCSVYGNPDDLPVTEETEIREAESPYARTKQICEQIIFDTARIHSQYHYVILRYFNPAGAHPSIEIGESPTNIANNLVPVITETAVGKREKLLVFGSDYPTRDGTCIRDYIYIMDLARAHTQALEYSLKGSNDQNINIFNLGSGTGCTVLEVIHAFEQETGQHLNYELTDRREGDVMAIYANHQKATEVLGWHPRHTIRDIMRTAWQWELKRSGKD